MIAAAFLLGLAAGLLISALIVIAAVAIDGVRWEKWLSKLPFISRG